MYACLPVTFSAIYRCILMSSNEFHCLAKNRFYFVGYLARLQGSRVPLIRESPGPRLRGTLQSNIERDFKIDT